MKRKRKAGNGLTNIEERKRKGRRGRKIKKKGWEKRGNRREVSREKRE